MHMPFLLPIAVAVFLFAVAAGVLYLRRHQTYAKCSNCGAQSQFGYSRQAESEGSDIVRLCLPCLVAKLRDDYRNYAARALVIEPAADLPCYVFQPKNKWSGSKLAEDLTTLLGNMEDACSHCRSHANYLWVTSNGLLPSTFDQIFSEGLSQTIFKWGNQQPVSLCGPCCLAVVKKAIESRGLTFLEVCGPRSQDGIIIPMGY
jgi:hypothetical protein